MQPVFADSVNFEKTLDVHKESLAKTLLNLQDYQSIFPQIKSVDWIDKQNQIALIKAQESGFGIEIPVQIKSEGDDRIIFQVSSGKYQGSKMTMTLNETWGFDGTPNAGTIVIAEVTANIPFPESLFVSEKDIQFGLDSGLVKIAEYANEKYPQVTNPDKDITQEADPVLIRQMKDLFWFYFQNNFYY